MSRLGCPFDGLVGFAAKSFDLAYKPQRSGFFMDWLLSGDRFEIVFQAGLNEGKGQVGATGRDGINDVSREDPLDEFVFGEAGHWRVGSDSPELSMLVLAGAVFAGGGGRRLPGGLPNGSGGTAGFRDSLFAFGEGTAVPRGVAFLYSYKIEIRFLKNGVSMSAWWTVFGSNVRVVDLFCAACPRRGLFLRRMSAWWTVFG